ncbi:hypothetical protein AAFF_G00148840 [Aldrovandia affinis]|uniref:Syndecan n=1 Tax=Aldrovandia affinis TaxID=143900 RepID=A0AAD7RPK7_9TELE|nr:hypothetical protein AAFF_G00148840 [Aldrovandia affinis]
MMQITVLLLVCVGPWIHTAQSGPAEEFDSSSMYPEDQDVSGDDLEMSGSGSGLAIIEVPDFSAPLNVTTPLPAIKTTEVSLTTEQAGGVVRAVEDTAAPSCPAPSSRPASPTTAVPSTVGPGQLTTGPSESEIVPEVPLLPTTSDSPATTREVATPPPAKATSPPTATEAIPMETTQALLTTLSSPTTAAAPVIVDADIEASAEAPAETTTLAGEEEEEEETPTPTEKTNLLPAMTPVADAEFADSTQDDMVSGDGGFVTSTTSPLTTKAAEPLIPLDEEIIVPKNRDVLEEEISNDSDLTFDPEKALSSSENQSLLERKEVLGGVIAGGIVGLAFAIMLVSLMVYRMKKKDEGSYALDEQKHPNGGYQKAQRQEEFLA